jgi:kumamolisin
VWNDGGRGGATGGGESAFFPLPTWQAGLRATSATATAPLKHRGVPDVCGDADPETGYDVLVDASATTIGGTSAVAPLWAALIARINANANLAVGYITPKLYGAPTAFHDITQGSNGAFDAAPGWDACTGLGSPDGAAVARVFESS